MVGLTTCTGRRHRKQLNHRCLEGAAVKSEPQSVSYYLILFFSPVFNQVGQLRTFLIYNCELAKIKQSSVTKTTTQSSTWNKQTVENTIDENIYIE